MRRFHLFWLMLLAVPFTPVEGQVFVPRHPVAAVGAASWFMPYGYGYGGYGYGSAGTTAAQSYMMGMSQVIRAQGEANAYNAQAAINYEQARGAYIENSKKWTEAYYQRKELYQKSEADKAARARQSRDNYLASLKTVPSPTLAPSQLDPVTGHIIWPEALASDTYAPQRRKIEELVQIRRYTGMTEMLAQQLSAVARDMQNELRSHITDLPANTYVAARKFLDGLLHEAQPPKM